MTVANAANALDVKRKIVTLLKGLDPTWDVSWGGSKTPGRMYVFVGQIEWEDTHYVTNKTIEETFKVKVVINHKARRTDSEKVETAVLGVMKQIRDAIKAQPNLNDGNVVTAFYSPKGVGSYPADDFWEAQAEGDITITARF